MDFIKDTKLSKELKLLFLASMSKLSEDAENEILNLISEGLDWDLFLKLVITHRTYMLVYKNLSKLKVLDKNGELFMSLEKLNKENKIKTIKFTTELINITKAFQENNIKSIPIKGPALSVEVYDNLFLRVSSDLDILVEVDDLDKAEATLFKLGYKKVKDERNLTTKQINYIKKHYHHFGYLNNKGVLVELHWRLHEFANYTDFERLFESSKTIEIFDEKIHVLKEEDNLIALMLHGTKHGWTKVKWLCDIEAIIQNGNINWHILIIKAASLGLLQIVGQTLILVKELFNIEIPKEVYSLMDDKKSKGLAVRAFHFMTDICESKEGNNKLKFKIYSYLWLNSITKGFKYFTNFFKPKIDDFNLIKLPDSLFVLYFVVRPIHYLSKRINS